jgi:DNA-directed RNA polymerase subunit RPC12/RpoP
MVKCSNCKSKLDEDFYIEWEWKFKDVDLDRSFDAIMEPEPERVVVCTKCGHRIPEAKIRKFGLEEVFFR